MKLLPLLSLAAVVLAGCSESKKPLEIQSVTGKVFYEGKPAEGVRVFFYPTTAPQPPDVPQHPFGVTGADGRFTLSTFAKDDGAPLGGYQIVLLWPAAESESATDDDRFLGWFDIKHTKYTFEVKSGANEVPTIQINTIKGPPPESTGVPGRN
jgi:hypothetical protein